MIYIGHSGKCCPKNYSSQSRETTSWEGVVREISQNQQHLKLNLKLEIFSLEAAEYCNQLHSLYRGVGGELEGTNENLKEFETVTGGSI